MILNRELIVANLFLVMVLVSGTLEYKYGNDLPTTP